MAPPASDLRADVAPPRFIPGAPAELVRWAASAPGNVDGTDAPARVDASAIAAWAAAVEAAGRALGSRPPWALDDALALHAADPWTRGPTLVLGMGGSALGARAALAVAAADGDRSATVGDVRVVDTVDPLALHDAAQFARQTGAALQVISKSGSTVEVLAMIDVLRAALAPDAAPRGVVHIADPSAQPTAIDGALADLRASCPCAHRRIAIPPAVGGRYSVLTAVGQLPLWAAGVDPAPLLQGARTLIDAWPAPADPATAEREPAFGLDGWTEAWRDVVREAAWRRWSATRVRAAAGAGSSVSVGLIVWCYRELLGPWAAWLQQLECESLGRAHGAEAAPSGELITPLRGPADQHSVAQLLLDGPVAQRVLFVDAPPVDASFGAGEVGDALRRAEQLRRAELFATADALTLPTARLELAPGLQGLGAAFVRGMGLTLVLGALAGVDPYGQPAVERIKRNIRGRLQSAPPSD